MDEAGAETDYETTLYVNNVRRYIQNHYARQATSCFGRASAESGAAVGGRVVIGFTISATGGTESVHVVRNDSGVEALGACLVNRVDSWEMPAPPRGEPVELALPFSS
jgi:TonB family protein